MFDALNISDIRRNMLNHESMRKIWVVIPIALLATIAVTAPLNCTLTTPPRDCCEAVSMAVSMAISGNNLYMA